MYKVGDLIAVYDKHWEKCLEVKIESISLDFEDILHVRQVLSDALDMDTIEESELHLMRWGLSMVTYNHVINL